MSVTVRVQRQNKKSARKEWLILSVALIIIGAFLGSTLAFEHNETLRREREHLLSQATILHDNFVRHLESINRALANARADWALWQQEAPQNQSVQRANARLRAFAEVMVGVRTMLILDTKGTVVASSRQELMHKDLSHRAFFQAALANPSLDTLYISPPFQTSLGVWTIVIARLIIDVQGQFAGVVGAALSPEAFSSLLESVRYTDDTWAAILHGKGESFLVVPDIQKNPHQHLTPFQPGITLGRHKNQQAVIWSDEEHLIASRKVQPNTLKMDQPLVVLAARERAVLCQSLRTHALIQVSLFVALVVGSTGGLWFYQRRRRTTASQIRNIDRRLQEVRTELEHFFSLALDLLCISDFRGNFIKLNPAWETTLGYRLEDLEGAFFFDFVHPDDIRDTQGALSSIAREGVLPLFINRYRHQDGSYRWIEWRSFAHGDKIYAVAHDITAHRESEAKQALIHQELIEAKARADAANHAKSAFLANMSHEIRTPMNAIIGLLELMRHFPLHPQQVDYLDKAQMSARLLLAIINDILDFSKIEAQKLLLEQAPFRVERLIQSLSAVLSSAPPNRDTEVLFDVDMTLPDTLVGDVLRLQQILVNLLGNAVKFTKSGEVVLQLRALEVLTDCVKVGFSIRDTGIGIPPEQIGTIFEGFAQAESSTSRRFGGTGLGLSISQRLVQLMGGELQVESTPGAGSCFHFTISLARDTRGLEMTDTSRRGRYVYDPQAPVLRVLIVDDNRIARSILEKMAATFHWKSDTAASGEEALVKMGEAVLNIQPYDAILIDWLMPGMDGWETAQQIRKLYGCLQRSPVIVMVTAHGREVFFERMNHDGSPFDGFLVKPIMRSALFDAIAEASNGRFAAIGLHTRTTRPTRRLNGLRLLVVEDNPINQQVAQELLAYEGAQVEVANDGHVAIERITVTAKPFDAVLMDIQMPGIDGYETTRILREQKGVIGLPIIAMTANAQPSDREACLLAGMNDHVGKPIDLNELISTLLHYCGDAVTAPLIEQAISKEKSLELPAQAAEILPNLPEGFALEEALARLHNDKVMYARLVRSFSQDQAEVAHKMREMVIAGQRDTAIREAHTLKGVAATLGAMALAAAALAVEQHLKRNTSVRTGQTSLLFDHLDEALADGLAVLRQMANIFDPPVVQAATKVNVGQCLAQLQTLDSLLAESNMRALDVFSTMTPPDEAQASFEALSAAMARLDFTLARERIAEIQKALGH